GPNGNLWFTESLSTDRSSIGEINDATHAINEFRLPNSFRIPSGITTGFNGHVWFTETSIGRCYIGKFFPEDGHFEEFAIPTANCSPGGITFNSFDDAIYFTEDTGNNIGIPPPPSPNSRFRRRAVGRLASRPGRTLICGLPKSGRTRLASSAHSTTAFTN